MDFIKAQSEPCGSPSWGCSKSRLSHAQQHFSPGVKEGRGEEVPILGWGEGECVGVDDERKTLSRMCTVGGGSSWAAFRPPPRHVAAR